VARDPLVVGIDLVEDHGFARLDIGRRGARPQPQHGHSPDRGGRLVDVRDPAADEIVHDGGQAYLGIQELRAVDGAAVQELPHVMGVGGHVPDRVGAVEVAVAEAHGLLQGVHAFLDDEEHEEGHRYGAAHGGRVGEAGPEAGQRLLPAPPEGGGQQHDNDRVFIERREHEGGTEADQGPADPAAQGRRKIEVRQARCRRPQLVERPVGHQAHEEENREVTDDGKPVHRPQEEHEQAGQQDLGPGIAENAGHAAAGAEGHDETAQVQGKRQDPGQGERPDLEGDVVRHGQQERRGEAGQQQPFPVGRGADGLRVRPFFGPAGGRRRSQVGAQQKPGCDDEGGVQDIGQAPDDALQPDPHEGLGHEGIAQKRDQGARVGCGIERVGLLVRAQAGLAQPGLGHDGRRGEHREGDRNVNRQDVEKMRERGMRVGLGVNLKGQVHEGKGEDRQVPHAELLGEEVGVEIADEQGGLEEHQAREPHVGRAAEIGGQQAPRERLEPEEQNRPAEDHGRQDGHGQPVASRIRRFHPSQPPKAVFHTAYRTVGQAVFCEGAGTEGTWGDGAPD